MHADTLYHRMLDQERVQKEAEEAGLPIPQFPPIIPKPRSAGSTSAIPSSFPAATEPKATAQSRTPMGALTHEEKTMQTDQLTPEARAELQKRMKDKPDIVRELEERAMLAEAESDASVGKRIAELQSSGRDERRQRREKGEATISDTISGWFGW